MTEFERRYFDLNEESYFQRIDEGTYLDLELKKLFEYIDCTDSAVGRQYLYNQLRSIPADRNTSMQERFLQHYSLDPNLQNIISKKISLLDHPDAYNIYSLIKNEYYPYSKNKRFCFFILQFLPTLFLLLFLVHSSSYLLIGLVVSFLINMFIHYQSKQISFDHSDSIPQLYNLIKVALELNPIIRYKLESNIEEGITILKTLKTKCAIFRFNTKMSSDLAIVVWIISEIFRVFFLIEPLNLDRIFQLIKKEKKVIENAFCFVGQIDSFQSIYRLREKSPFYCLPEFTDDNGTLFAENMYNPLLNNCVENSFGLKNGSFLIMGSNMSGKTTFIRTVGVNVLIAQTLNTGFCRSLKLNHQKIYSSITIKDDISKKQSYYLSEVLRIKSIVENTTLSSNLILLDELFKGTNTEERIACAQAILKYLANNANNRILVATHDRELASLLEEQFTPVFFTEDISDNQLTFSYKLSYTHSNQRNAIKILQLYDFPSSIINQALNQVDLIS